MSYGLNVEMHKQMEIAKRLNAIIAQLLPFLSQEVINSQLSTWGIEPDTLTIEKDIDHYSEKKVFSSEFIKLISTYKYPRQ